MSKLDNLKPFAEGTDARRNVNGRPKGAKNRSTLLRKWLDVKTKTKNSVGKEVTATVEDEVVLSLIEQARGGNVKAQALILDSVYGKVADKLEADIKGEIATFQITTRKPE